MKITVEQLNQLDDTDLNDICEATELAISDELGFTIGFNWNEPPSRDTLKSFWRGALLVPERMIFIGRVDDVIASSVQLVKPSRNNQASSFACKIEYHFVTPWARGHGLAQAMIQTMEQHAKDSGYETIRMAARVNKKAAIRLYENCGYQKWGELEKYEKQDSKYIKGLFYSKDL